MGARAISDSVSINRMGFAPSVAVVRLNGCSVPGVASLAGPTSEVLHVQACLNPLLEW